MKKIILFGTIIVGCIFLLRLLGGNEDSWICNRGSWVKHGNPSYPKPLVNCRNETPLPKDKEQCLVQGGVWKKIGIDPFESCNIKTIDRGNICRDNSECEGRCQVDLTREELQLGMRGKLHKTASFGHCSVWRVELGCQGVMEKGKVRVYCFD